MGLKKKKGQPEKIDVKGSEPHRRRGGWVMGYWRRRNRKAHRNDPYSRNPRRSKKEISKKGTRKEQREKLRMEQIKYQTKAKTKKQKIKKLKQLTFGKPRGPPKL